MQVGDRVSVKVSVFDDPEDIPEDRWSRVHFPDTFRTQRLAGEIIACVGRQKYRVRFDYDNSESVHHRRALQSVAAAAARDSGSDGHESESSSDSESEEGSSSDSDAPAPAQDIDPDYGAATSSVTSKGPSLSTKAHVPQKSGNHTVQESSNL